MEDFDIAKMLQEDQELKKGLGTTLALGAALLTGQTAPAAPKTSPLVEAAHRVGIPSEAATWTPEGLHTSLLPIAHLESSFGKNVKHAANSKGEYETAFGALGFKPSSANEEYNHSPVLQKLYGEFKDPSAFMAKFKTDPKFYNLVATSHFLRLQNRHGSPEAAAFAWRHGTGAASKATPEQIAAEPYVQKYKAMTLHPPVQPAGEPNTAHLAKSEPLVKMAIKDIKPGTPVKAQDGISRHDYSHLIKSPVLKAKYQLVVQHVDHPNYGTPFLNVRLIDRKTKERVGHIDSGFTKDSWNRRAIDPNVSEIHSKELQGKGLGKAMYSALLAHSYHHMGIRNVAGGTHSSLASRVHQSITKEHGLHGYNPQRLGPSNGAYDSAFDDYEYALKSELTKSINPKDLASVLRATTPAGPAMVDHGPDLKAHEALPPDELSAFPQQVEHYNSMLKSDKPFAKVAGKADVNGITAKSLFLGDNGVKYMVKPYHERVIKRIEHYQKHPIQGWAEMTNQALYHAAGIGDLHQQVHVAEHPMQSANAKADKEPALVVHMQGGHRPISKEITWNNELFQEPTQLAKDSARKIAVMDFLSNNLDRHYGNLLVNSEDGLPLAIDHSRSFQYHNNHRDKNEAAKNINRKSINEDSFRPYVNNSSLKPYVKLGGHSYDGAHKELQDWKPTINSWWGKNSGAIEETFKERLKQIKDPEVRAHLERNFMARVNWLNERAHFSLDNYGTDWYNHPVEWYPNGVK